MFKDLRKRMFQTLLGFVFLSLPLSAETRLDGPCTVPASFVASELGGSSNSTSDCSPTARACSISFAYRDPDALRLFHQMRDYLTEHCETARKDAPVNHPDTSIAWVFDEGPRKIRISYKDKAQLRRSLVTVEHLQIP